MAFACNSLDIEEIKRSNQEKFGQLFDFEKYKKQKEKLGFLRKFVNDVNNNKLFIHMLAQMEFEFVALVNEFSNNEEKLNEFINLYQKQINIFDLLINEVKHFPKAQLRSQGKDLKIKSTEFKLLDFFKKRVNELRIYLNNPNYLNKLLESLKISNEDITKKEDQEFDNETINVNKNPEFFLGNTYFVYSSINPNFIDEIIIDFINFYFKSELKNKTDEEIEEIKKRIKFKKIQLRYSETLEKLA